MRHPFSSGRATLGRGRRRQRGRCVQAKAASPGILIKRRIPSAAALQKGDLPAGRSTRGSRRRRWTAPREPAGGQQSPPDVHFTGVGANRDEAATQILHDAPPLDPGREEEQHNTNQGEGRIPFIDCPSSSPEQRRFVKAPSSIPPEVQCIGTSQLVCKRGNGPGPLVDNVRAERVHSLRHGIGVR